ncbi:putative 3-hydroxybutyryl-CoA dehydrogenase [compost metagenome]
MQIRTVGVIGAGTMGNGIAQVCAMAGLQVIMQDVSEAALNRGMANISKSLDKLGHKQALDEDSRQATLQRILCSTNKQALADSDLVIEAATEAEALKLKILADIGQVLPEHALIASNTSSLSITTLATASGRPDRFIGMHFFNPVPVMALVELIRGLQTSDETQAMAAAFVAQIHKTAICARNSPGFAVNRILVPMINEAVFVLQEGLASAQDIDDGMRLGCSHPIGPLALADLIGLDTLLSVMQMLHEGFNDSKYRPAALLRELVDAGYLGRKSGRGFFRYG